MRISTFIVGVIVFDSATVVVAIVILATIIAMIGDSPK